MTAFLKACEMQNASRIHVGDYEMAVWQDEEPDERISARLWRVEIRDGSGNVVDHRLSGAPWVIKNNAVEYGRRMINACLREA